MGVHMWKGLSRRQGASLVRVFCSNSRPALANPWVQSNDPNCMMNSIQQTWVRSYFDGPQTNGSWPPNQTNSNQENTQSTQTSNLSLELGDDVVVNVSTFKNMVLTHVRRYFYNKESKRLPGRDGVTLGSADVDKLEQITDDLDLDISRISKEYGHVDPKYPFPLSSARKVEVLMRDSVPLVRFEHNSQGKIRTIELGIEQYSMLKNFIPIIKEEIQNLKQQTTKAAKTFFELELSSWVAVRVIQFSSGIYVDLRKVQNGQKTKAGISVRPNEWELINLHLDEIQNALFSGDLQYKLELSQNRFVSLNYYQQQWYVVIREYYIDEATGSLKPGFRGMNLRYEDWANLVPHIPNITEQLRSAQTNA